LRASAVLAQARIIVLRVALRVSAVRARSHCASALSFWKIRNRLANWIMPRRTRALPAPSELYSRVGFIVNNLARPAERVVAFYNQRGTAEQWIKEGKGAIKWTRLSCRTFAANARTHSSRAAVMPRRPAGGS
jgi:hypothetical protein